MVAQGDDINTPPPSPKVSRIEAIRLALRASEDAGKRQHELGEAAILMQNAERQLTEAEEKVEECLDKLNKSAVRFNHTMVCVRDAFSPPPSQHQEAKAIVPETPKCKAPTPATTPKRVSTPATLGSSSTPYTKQGLVHTPGSPAPKRPGGILRYTTSIPPQGEVIEKGSNFPAYIVYIGPNNNQQLFTSWKSIPEKGIEGVEAWIAGVEKPFFKGFRSLERARHYFRECEEQGVFEALKVVSSRNTNSLYYVVTRGVAPGVYDNKSRLLCDGLQWRGGTVTVVDGPKLEARRLFNDWLGRGEVEYLERFIGDV